MQEVLMGNFDNPVPQRREKMSREDASERFIKKNVNNDAFDDFGMNNNPNPSFKKKQAHEDD